MVFREREDLSKRTKFNPKKDDKPKKQAKPKVKPKAPDDWSNAGNYKNVKDESAIKINDSVIRNFERMKRYEEHDIEEFVSYAETFNDKTRALRLLDKVYATLLDTDEQVTPLQIVKTLEGVLKINDTRLLDNAVERLISGKLKLIQAKSEDEPSEADLRQLDAEIDAALKDEREQSMPQVEPEPESLTDPEVEELR